MDFICNVSERSLVSYRTCILFYFVPWVLWHCWLGGWKGIRPVKTELWGAGVVICLELCADLHMAPS